MKAFNKTATLTAFAATVTLSMAGAAQAADFSFRGTFTNDNDVQLFNFNVGAASTVTLKTLSYAGGTQADGTVVARGGFDPILALFDGSGNFINSNDDGGSNVPADSVTGLNYDTFLQAGLNPGNYTVAVSQFNNFFRDETAGANIALGFDFDGAANANFRNGFRGRTNQWAFDVLNVDSASTPPTQAIPTPALLPGLIGLGMGVLRKRKRAVEGAVEA